MREDIRLSDLDQWLPYRHVRRDNGKTGKPPVDHRTGKIENGTDPACWLSFTDARAYAQKHNLPGVGFMPTQGDPFCCIDLDDCIASGVLSQLATEIIAKHDTYVELSPSKTGAHIWLKTDCMINLNRKHQGIEIYSHDQFVTWTGNRWPSAPNRIAWADLGWLVERYQSKPEQAPASPPRSYSTVSPDDQNLWSVIKRYDRTNRIERLYDGNLSVVGNNHSTGMIVLLNALAKYTKGDKARMARMMHQTALVNDKWDSPRKDTTWLDYEIDNACAYVGV